MDLDAFKYGFGVVIYYIRFGYIMKKDKRLL